MAKGQRPNLDDFDYDVLASSLGSGTSAAVDVPYRDTAVLQIKREASNAFSITVEERIHEDFGWATLASYDETDIEQNDTLTDRIGELCGGEMRVDHESGEAVTVAVRYRG